MPKLRHIGGRVAYDPARFAQFEIELMLSGCVIDVARLARLQAIAAKGTQ